MCVCIFNKSIQQHIKPKNCPAYFRLFRKSDGTYQITKFNEVNRIFNKIASNYLVDPAKFDFLLPRLVQIEKMSEYGTEFIITPIVSNTYQSIFIPEKPDEQFKVNKVLILKTPVNLPL